MRVVSLVPSLTETLLAAGVNVVGRTRFCIHPAADIAAIPVVGGTKEVNWDTVAELDADLVVFDREENTREMADACPLPWLATHITSPQSAGTELARLAECLDSVALAQLANEWQTISSSPVGTNTALQQLPGIEHLVGDQSGPFRRIEYMIWRDPWMSAGSDTFIHEMLKRVGVADLLVQTEVKYPELAEHELPRADTYYLFSTEPFPFARYRDELASSGFNGAIVDGEFYSWFGIRSLRLLQQWMSETT